MFQEQDKNSENTVSVARIMRAFHAAFWAEYRQFALWIVVIFAFGIMAFEQWYSDFSFVQIGSIALMVLMGVLFCRHMKWPKLFWSLMICFIFTTGVASMSLRIQNVQSPMMTSKTLPVLVMGKVGGVTQLPDKAMRLTMHAPYIEGIEAEHRPDKVKIKVKATYMPEQVLRAGHDIMVMAVLMPASDPVVKNGFDFKRYAYFKKIGASGYAVENVLIRDMHSKPAPFMAQLKQKLRQNIQGNIRNSDHAAIAMALLLGDKKAISYTLMQDIRIAGIAHLLAISGLHIGLIAAMFFLTMRQILVMLPYIGQYWRCKEIAFGVSFVMVAFYVVLVGAPISALRAIVMVFLVMVALFLGRRALSLRLVSFTALALLIFVPEALFQSGFQMSFAAVIALVAFYEQSHDWWQRQYQKTGFIHKVYLYFMGAFATTFIASIATAPIALYHFQQLSLINGLVMNLAAVPLVGFVILPLGVVAVLLSLFSWHAGVFSLMGWFIGLLMQLMQYVVAHGFDLYHISALPPLCFFFLMLGFLCLCFWVGEMRFLAIVPFGLAVFLGVNHKPADILIGEQGQLWAIYDHKSKELLFNHKRGYAFTRQQWRQHMGQDTKDDMITIPKFGQLGDIFCDDMACRMNRAGVKASILHMPHVLSIECEYADLILLPQHITPKITVKNCDADLYYFHESAYITFDKGDYAIEAIF